MKEAQPIGSYCVFIPRNCVVCPLIFSAALILDRKAKNKSPHPESHYIYQKQNIRGTLLNSFTYFFLSEISPFYLLKSPLAPFFLKWGKLLPNSLPNSLGITYFHILFLGFQFSWSDGSDCREQTSNSESGLAFIHSSS
jgi:hypothetical protein